VRLWDAVTGATVWTLKGHSGWASSVAFSPDGKQVVSRSDDNTVRLWDAATGAALQTLEGHSGPISQGVNTLHALSEFNNWIVEGESKLVWLPPASRSTCTAVRNNFIVLGHLSGRISILGFKEGLKLI
jgi:WD40 repeat protein